MAKKITDLMKPNNNLPLTTRYTKKQLGKYQKELELMLRMVDGGHCIPAIHELREYFDEVHNISVGDQAIRRHIKRLQEGKEIWPAS